MSFPPSPPQLSPCFPLVSSFFPSSLFSPWFPLSVSPAKPCLFASFVCLTGEAALPAALPRFGLRPFLSVNRCCRFILTPSSSCSQWPVRLPASLALSSYAGAASSLKNVTVCLLSSSMIHAMTTTGMGVPAWHLQALPALLGPLRR